MVVEQGLSGELLELAQGLWSSLALLASLMEEEDSSGGLQYSDADFQMKLFETVIPIEGPFRECPAW
jgi:hypothetical protein